MLKKTFLTRLGFACCSVVALSLGLQACKEQSFVGKTPGTLKVKPAEPVVPTGKIHFACALAAAEAVLGNELESGSPVMTRRTCSDEMQSSDQVVGNRPLDLVFVLDVTMSMQPSINTVKENVVEFTRRIGSKGWNARFAAVAFRDPPGSTAGHYNDPNYELLYSTGFMNDEGIRAEISSGANQWVAYDLSDNQEGGQAAISKAIDLLKSQRRVDSDAAILYVSDAPAFKDKDHWNFTINDLATKLSGVPNVRFFHSTLSVDHPKYVDLPSEPEWIGKAEYSIAKNQMEDLRTTAGKDGIWLPFPLDKSTFINSFAEQFATVYNKVSLECLLVQATVQSASGQTVASFISKNPLGETSGEDELKLNSGLAATGDFVYREKRCCVQRNAGVLGNKCEKVREGSAAIVIR